MVLIGIDPYPYVLAICCLTMLNPQVLTRWSRFPWLLSDLTRRPRCQRFLEEIWPKSTSTIHLISKRKLGKSSLSVDPNRIPIWKKHLVLDGMLLVAGTIISRGRKNFRSKLETLRTNENLQEKTIPQNPMSCLVMCGKTISVELHHWLVSSVYPQRIGI